MRSFPGRRGTGNSASVPCGSSTTNQSAVSAVVWLKLHYFDLSWIWCKLSTVVYRIVVGYAAFRAARCAYWLLASTVVLTPWLGNPALSTVTIRITQLLCVRSHSLELTSNSRWWLVVIIIILLLSPCTWKLNYSAWRELARSWYLLAIRIGRT